MPSSADPGNGYGMACPKPNWASGPGASPPVGASPCSMAATAMLQTCAPSSPLALALPPFDSSPPIGSRTSAADRAARRA
eukprot:90399-Chlamydomonas_euryale.AAC.3